MCKITPTILLIAVAIWNVNAIFHSDCPRDNVTFETKLVNSSFVVYGKPTAKTLYNDSDSMFFGTFRVDCILKGEPIDNIIHIMRAGHVKGKTYCQDLSVGRDYVIAFLERDPLQVNVTNMFIPTDFADMPVEGNVTYDLLADTCTLQRIIPIGSKALMDDVCPKVSTNSKCVPKIIVDATTLHTGAIIIPGQVHNITDGIRSKSGSVQIDVDGNAAMPIRNINILLIFMAIWVRLY